jgi:hypothetical protein
MLTANGAKNIHPNSIPTIMLYPVWNPMIIPCPTNANEGVNLKNEFNQTTICIV